MSYFAFCFNMNEFNICIFMDTKLYTNGAIVSNKILYLIKHNWLDFACFQLNVLKSYCVSS